MTINYMGYEIDPEAGIIYGRKGQPITAVSRGYIKVNHGREGISASGHRMIWEAVHGPIPDGLQINHINCIKNDNRIENLEVVTPSGNTRHAYKNGCRSAKGTHNGRAKLNPDMVRQLRREHAAGATCYRLGKWYGVDPKTVRLAVARETWAEVQ